MANTSLLDSHLNAENDHDVAKIMATYVASPRVTINGKTFIGLKNVELFHVRMGFGGGGAFSDVRVKEIKRHVAGEVVIIEQLLSGRHTGRWQGMAPTDKRFEVPVCTIYSLGQSGALISEDVYFDSAQILKQLDAKTIP